MEIGREYELSKAYTAGERKGRGFEVLTHTLSNDIGDHLQRWRRIERGVQQRSEQQTNNPAEIKETSRQAARVGRTTTSGSCNICLGIRACV